MATSAETLPPLSFLERLASLDASSDLNSAYNATATPRSSIHPSYAPSTTSFDELSIATSGPPTPTQKKSGRKGDVTSIIKSKTLQIATASHMDTRLARTLRSLHVFCPVEEPLEHDATFSCKDRRNLGPLSIRFRAPKGEKLITNYFRQDLVIDSLWSSLKDLLPDQPSHNVRPSVLFEEDEDYANEDIFACITLICATVESFMLIRDNLNEIRVEDEAKHTSVYTQRVWSNTLPGHILPLDILRVPLDAAALTDFWLSINHMASKVGRIVGVGSVSIDSWRGDGSETSGGIVRAYCELSPSSMQLDLNDFINLLPTRFQWEGVLYGLFYSGRDLHEIQANSLNYPRERPASSVQPSGLGTRA